MLSFGAVLSLMIVLTVIGIDRVNRIENDLTQINDIFAAIADSVGQQESATGEIARSVEQVSNGTRSVTVNIGGVTEAAEQTGSAAHEVLNSAENLGQQSQVLMTRVDGFVARIRQA